MSDVFDFDTYVMAHLEKHPPQMQFGGDTREQWYVWQKRLRTIGCWISWSRFPSKFRWRRT